MMSITKNFNAVNSDDCSKEFISCELCALSRLCLPNNIDKQDLKKLDAIIIRHSPLKRGTHWFRRGERFRSLFVVRTGCVKIFTTTETGQELIGGFYLPGEIIGLDAIENGRYLCSSKVLQASSFCEIPFSRLEAICNTSPDVQRQLIKIMSKELLNNRWLITLLGKTTAEERVAALLCNISERFSQRGYSARSFTLGMPRSDIGNFLGLAVETVSRVFTRLQKEHVIHANGKHISIINQDKLYSLGGLDTFSN